MAPNPEWYLEKKFRQGLLLLLIVIAIDAGVSVRALRNMRKDENRVTNTQAVLTQIETTLSTLEAAETGQRGYLYTGRSDYLRPYLFATQELDGQLKILAQMTADNPSERERVAALRPLVDEKMEEMAQTIALHDAGDDAGARRLVLSEIGREKMDDIRQLLNDMRQGEQHMLVERTLKSQETARSGAIALIVASSLAAALIVLLVYVITRDLRKVAKAQAEISERQAWLQTTLRSIGDAVIATDTDGNIKFLNGVAEKLTGWKSEEAAGHAICDVFAIFDEETGQPREQPVRRVLQTRAICGLANHTVLRNRAGHDMPINDSAAPIVDDQGNISGVVLVFRDDTQRRKSEAALVRAEKFAATGRMAATLAHEINNPLEAAMNLVYLARKAPGLSPEFQGYLQAAQSQLEFAAHASRRTLTIYRSDVTPGTARLEQILEEVASFYDGRLRSRGIELVRKYSFKDNIVMNAADMRQAFSNVISNAVDACGPGDTITLQTLRVEENDNHRAVVVIEDSGPGVPKQDRDRLFEPFFTTKPSVGTGLGLWVTRQIVEQNGGRIELRTDAESENHGTQVSIMLPIKTQVTAKAAN